MYLCLADVDGREMVPELGLQVLRVLLLVVIGNTRAACTPRPKHHSQQLGQRDGTAVGKAAQEDDKQQHFPCYMCPPAALEAKRVIDNEKN